MHTPKTLGYPLSVPHIWSPKLHCFTVFPLQPVGSSAIPRPSQAEHPAQAQPGRPHDFLSAVPCTFWERDEGHLDFTPACSCLPLLSIYCHIPFLFFLPLALFPDHVALFCWWKPQVLLGPGDPRAEHLPSILLVCKLTLWPTS